MATVMDPTLASSPSMTCESDWRGLKVNLFAFDFDGTCTQKDTTSLLYKATDKYLASTEAERKQLDALWSELGKKYWSGHQDVVSRSLSVNDSPSFSAYNEKELRSFLQKVYEYDLTMMKQIEGSKILQGISKESIKEAAQEVKLNPGCLNVLNHVNLPLYLISVNWCQDLIHAKLGHLKHLNIFGNNLPLEGELSSGHLGKTLTSAFDKERIFQDLIGNTTERSDGVSVFVGDSITDLLALLRSDVGILIGKSQTVRKVAKSFGIKLLPLQDIQEMKGGDCHENANPKQKGVLFEAPSWNEIGFILFGTKYSPNKF